MHFVNKNIESNSVIVNILTGVVYTFNLYDNDSVSDSSIDQDTVYHSIIIVSSCSMSLW